MTKRRLFLSRIDNNFDPAHDVAAGPWCFVGREDAVKGWEELPFTSPFPDKKSYLLADARTHRLANHIALSWAEKMNINNNCSYSPVFWRNFLILWVIAATQAMWRCFRNLELLVKRHKTDSLHLRVLDHTPAWSINNLGDFMQLLQKDGYFHFWMQSLCIRRLAPEAWTLEPTPWEDYPSDYIQATVDSVSAVPTRSSLKDYIGRLGFDHVTGTYYSRPFFSLFISLLPRGPAEGKTFDPDPAVIEEFPALFVEVLQKFLLATLPSTYSKDFSAIEKEVKALPYSPGRLTITQAASIDTKLQLINTLAVEAGERVVGFQHGGWFGTALVEAWASESEYIYHAFITWGWSAQSDMYAKTLPLPSPALSKLRNKHTCKGNDLVYVGARMVINNERFHASPSPVRWLQYRKDKVIFISNLEKRLIQLMFYRPHVGGEILEDSLYLKKFFSSITFMMGSKKTLRSKLLSCRLLILDHPGTTLHEAMAANTPTVCYWNNEDWPISRQSEPQFEALRQSGILFDDPESAAQHVNNIWNDVPRWWNSDKVQVGRQIWSSQHARTSPIWFWHWATALWRLSVEKRVQAARP